MSREITETSPVTNKTAEKTTPSPEPGKPDKSLGSTMSSSDPTDGAQSVTGKEQSGSMEYHERVSIDAPPHSEESVSMLYLIARVFGVVS